MPSPTIKMEGAKPRLMSFPEAMQEVVNGHAVTRLEWADGGWHGFLTNGRLSLRKPDGSVSPWLVSDGDMFGNDWTVARRGHAPDEDRG